MDTVPSHVCCFPFPFHPLFVHRSVSLSFPKNIILTLGTSLKLRLLGDPLQGAVVEVYDGVSKWGQICPNTWTTSDARFVCSYFGYAGTVAAIKIPLDVSALNDTTNNKIIRIWRCGLDNFPYTDRAPCLLFPHECEESFLSCNIDVSTDCECSSLNAGVISSTNPTGMFVYILYLL